MFDEDDDGLDSVDLDLDDETPQPKALPEAARETPTSKPLSPEVAAARREALDYDWHEVETDESGDFPDGYNHETGITNFDGDHEIETDAINDRINEMEARLQKLIVEAELAATVEAWNNVLKFKKEEDMGEITELSRFRDDIVSDCDGGRRRFDAGFTVTQDSEDEGEEWDEDSAKANFADRSKIDWDDPPFSFIDWSEVADYLNENESRSHEYDSSSELNDNWYHYD